MLLDYFIEKREVFQAGVMSCAYKMVNEEQQI